MRFSKRPVITIKEARRLLGKDAKNLTDTEIMDIVNNLRILAINYIYNKNVKKSKNVIGLGHGLPEPESESP